MQTSLVVNAQLYFSLALLDSELGWYFCALLVKPVEMLNCLRSILPVFSREADLDSHAAGESLAGLSDPDLPAGFSGDPDLPGDAAAALSAAALTSATITGTMARGAT